MDDQNQKALSLIPFPDVTGSSIPTLTSLINSCTQPDYSPLIPPASELLEIRKDLQIIQSAAISRERAAKEEFQKLDKIVKDRKERDELLKESSSSPVKKRKRDGSVESEGSLEEYTATAATESPPPPKTDVTSLKQTLKKKQRLQSREASEVKAVSYEPSESVGPTASEPPPANNTNIPPVEETKIIKPSAQITSTTFWNYLEPYFRPFTKDDVVPLIPTNLDDPTPFLIPPFGPKKYTEIWAEEEKSLLPQNSVQPVQSSSTTNITNPAKKPSKLENDPTVSTIPTDFNCPPLTERIISAIMEDLRSSDEPCPSALWSSDDEDVLIKPKPNVAVTESGKLFDDLSFADRERVKDELYDMEDRLIRELRFIGVFNDDDIKTIGYELEDEITLELRRLQNDLRYVTDLNNLRKSVLMEKLLDHLAFEEYQLVLDEINRQVDQLYQRRVKSSSKKKKKLGVGLSNNMKSSSDQQCSILLDRRQRLLDELSPIFPKQQFTIPCSGDMSIFKNIRPKSSNCGVSKFFENSNDVEQLWSEERIIDYIMKPHVQIKQRPTVVNPVTNSTIPSVENENRKNSVFIPSVKVTDLPSSSSGPPSSKPSTTITIPLSVMNPKVVKKRVSKPFVKKEIEVPKET